MRTATQIAYRAAALTALLVRLDVEADRRVDGPRAETLFSRLRHWLTSEDLERHLSNREREVVAARLGAVDERTVFELSWRLQALAPLVWAIGKLEAMPLYFEPSSLTLLRPAMPHLTAIGAYVRCHRRPEAALLRERDRAELWHWRMRTRLHLRDCDPEVIRRAAMGARERGLIESTRDGDLDCGGVAYRDLPHPAWADAASTAVERHWALNWICGHGDDWDHVPTDT